MFTLLVNLDTGPSHRGTDQQAKPELIVQSTHLGKVRDVIGRKGAEGEEEGLRVWTKTEAVGLQGCVLRKR